VLSKEPSFEQLWSLFPDADDRPRAVVVPADEVPEPYHRLLVHNHHMTVTVEDWFGGGVDVKVLASRRNADDYARKILLAMHEGGRVVQFGLVRIDLGVCPSAVRDAIVEGKTPLGRVLIQHDMLRRIEPTAFIHVALGKTMAGWFGSQAEIESYGRLGVIYTGEKPAVEVLEILAPIAKD
jgi:hypothetical protein